MADLKDLGYTSILNMDNDESIERLRQIRLSRRIPLKKKSSTKKQKKVDLVIDSTAASAILKLLGGDNE